MQHTRRLGIVHRTCLVTEAWMVSFTPRGHKAESKRPYTVNLTGQSKVMLGGHTNGPIPRAPPSNPRHIM